MSVHRWRRAASLLPLFALFATLLQPYGSASAQSTLLPQAELTTTNQASFTDADVALVRQSLQHPIQDDVFYFVLPDRFSNGDTSNDTGGIAGGPTAHGFLPSEKGYYHGGDFKGLQANLPYLQEMGVSAIWMTPIFKNKPLQEDGSSANGVSAGYHGYWITDFTQVDPHLGTNDELKTLIADAQGRGMKVFFDIITNHTADVIKYEEGTDTPYRNKADFPYKDANGQAFDDVDYAGQPNFPALNASTSFPYKPVVPAAEATVKKPEWLNNPIFYHNRGDTTYSGENSTYGDFIKSLDDLFTEHPQVVNGMTDIYKTWIKDFGIDGFRIDTVKHVNIEFWQKFGPEIMAYAEANGKPNFFMYGEVFDGEPAAKSVYTTKGQLPATLDFGFQGNARGFAAQSKATNDLRDFFAKDDYYTDANSNAYSLPTFLGNHDIGRVGKFVKDDNAGATDSEVQARDRLAHALMFFSRGMPVVYYGDEQGFVGDGGDKDARQDMFPSQVGSYNDDDLIGTDKTTADNNFDKTHPLYTAFKTYGEIRKANKALRRGAQIHRFSEGAAGIYAFSRIDRDEKVEYVVALNNAEQAKSATFQTFSSNAGFSAVYSSGAQALTTDASGKLTVDVPALGVVIYKANAPLGANTTIPDITISKPEPNTLVKGRVEVGASLTDSNRFAEVTFAVKIGNGDYTVIGTDNNAPYRVFYDTSSLAPETPLSFKAIVNDVTDDSGANYGMLNVATRTTAVVEDRGDNPDFVTIAGSFQGELGCPDDWQPGCANTYLNWERGDDVWQNTFNVPAGNWEYKAALNNSWEEAYGKNGGNIAINLPAATNVKFYYDHKTNWIADNQSSVIATAAGNFQSELGCSDDWQPDCLRSWLQDKDGDKIYSFETRALPAGNYEVKAAINEGWSESYGKDGQLNGPNIAFTVPTNNALVKFAYNAITHVLTITSTTGGNGIDTVTIPGSLQSELGCPGDWQPECANTFLNYDLNDDVWQNSFDVPAGSWEYKAAINKGWDENYGKNATRNGANIGLNLASPTNVKFYYDHKTKWVTDNKNSIIATVPGSFQSELGCSNDWQPDCLRSWLQDTDGDGTYSFEIRALPAGSYEAKVAINESWNENYGKDGVPGGANIGFTVPADNSPVFFEYNPVTHVLTITDGAPKGNIDQQAAHWLTANTFAWTVDTSVATSYKLHYASNGGMKIESGQITGGQAVDLTLAGGLSNELKGRYPHLASYNAFSLGTNDTNLIRSILKGQLAVAAYDSTGKIVDATGVQIPGVLDALYTYKGQLGVSFNKGTPTLRLWAPTAKSVKLHVYNDGTTQTATTVNMVGDAATGVWSYTGAKNWANQYYLYEVEVYAPTTRKVERNFVTDPYSFSLSQNSKRSQIVDLNDPALMPKDWTGLVKPALAAPEDIVLYELHVRDFSINDATVPETQRGTFKAFTQNGSNGMAHLRESAKAGLTHVHLLPAFDCASINEDKSTWPNYAELEAKLAAYPAGSAEQAKIIEELRDEDGFNWCYDPYHYTVPEGSFATNPNGATRVLEFREMVQSLSKNGLRVVMDVVYNHTAQSGQGEKSVLDKVVPGYYHRLNPSSGAVEKSTCCENTATEHNMMEKLMIDSLVTWATAYKVDAFRFDLMGHHMKTNLEKAQAALKSLTLAKNGVDGSKIYIYGEGWNFGEVENDKRGVNATQLNMAGTGIGTFSDRLRDAVRGGGPFDSVTDATKNQGFISGLAYDPNDSTKLGSLWLYQDLIHVGMAGNLKNYTLPDGRTGTDVKYGNGPAGYTVDPQEVVTYVEAHDNQTLWDITQYKLPASTSMADRVRVHNLGNDIVMLGQGVPFFQAGQDMLRSKSLDRNSYNSGDWFNKLDFTYQSNNWGVGLPIPEGESEAERQIQAQLLSNPALKPSKGNILSAVNHFREMLRIRKSSKLFRLETAKDINERLRYHNVGPNGKTALLVMSISDTGAVDLDSKYEQIVVVVNANDETQSFAANEFKGKAMQLHPVLVESVDPVVKTSTFNAATGTFNVPARTTAVFVMK